MDLMQYVLSQLETAEEGTETKELFTYGLRESLHQK
jgi:hypothetical protein